MVARHDFAEQTRRALRDRVGGNCSRPECGRTTLSASDVGVDKVDITGRAAHITAARPNGPRFDASLSQIERSDANNGIWLCSDCADLVDKHAGAAFSVGQLRSWKRAAEDRQTALARLRQQARRPTWLDRLSSPHYVNVPRLLHLAGSSALSPATTHALRNGFPRQGMLVRELVEIEEVLRTLSIKAVDIADIQDPRLTVVEGLPISYHRHCRTKNGTSESPDDVRNYSFNRSPLIYADCKGYRYIQPYDPIWATTNTATSTLRGGNVKLAGIAIVKAVSHQDKEVIASPLVFGIPDIFGF